MHKCLQVESCLRSILFWKEKAVKAEETEPTLESRFRREKYNLLLLISWW